MLLRLVPPPPWPAILFTVSFPTLPESLPLPASWDAHLQLLANTHLTMPPSLHALDKSVAWTALLHMVTFDLVSLHHARSNLDLHIPYFADDTHSNMHLHRRHA